jgi:hypothetical protein
MQVHFLPSATKTPFLLAVLMARQWITLESTVVLPVAINTI